jgi:hemerythrin-like metal-binding protein
MKQSIQSFGLSLFIVLAVIVIGIGFMFGLDNPVPWIMIALLAAVPHIHKRILARRFVAWDDSYSVGVEQLDNDHRRLIQLINNLQTAIHYPAGEQFEREALDALVDYTRTHFKREEELMEKYDFPGFEAHRQIHQNMIAEVDALMASYDKDPEKTLEKASSCLKRWLLNHINGTDQEYAAFFRQKNIQAHAADTPDDN